MPERPLQKHVNPGGSVIYVPNTVIIGPDVTIGIRTRFLGRVTIGQGSVINRDTIIYQSVTVQNRVTIGAGCVIGHDALIGHEAIIGEHSHVTPNANVPRYWRIPAQSIVNESDGRRPVILPRQWPR
ncbi:MAG: hypothetical protein WBP12_02260 [Candidatus Saccharimonas sp.]